ncbi:MAG TPA: CheR family methyltransferase [Syntrophales bacterium]|nr:CheR family methyltransferase [Syntrophales bacterium]
MDDNSFQQLLDRLGLSWSGYARVRKGIKKRVSRHMQELGLQTMKDYLHVLDDPEILNQVELLMGVSISHFFRDRYLWQVLGEEILPGIINRNREQIHVWSAGCALGQEVYSFTIMWDMLKSRFARLPQLHLLATDLNPDYLEKAETGVYGRSSLKGLPDDIRTIYFHESPNKANYHVVDYLKDNIVWQVHDLMRQTPPAGKFQIIFLRNSLLTYYREENRVSVFLKIVDSIDEGGFLFIGRREKLPYPIQTLSSFKDCSYIFQKEMVGRSHVQITGTSTHRP